MGVCACVTNAFNNCLLCFKCDFASKATTLCAGSEGAQGAVCGQSYVDATTRLQFDRCFNDPATRYEGLECMECNRPGAHCCGAFFENPYHSPCWLS